VGGARETNGKKKEEINSPPLLEGGGGVPGKGVLANRVRGATKKNGGGELFVKGGCEKKKTLLVPERKKDVRITIGRKKCLRKEGFFNVRDRITTRSCPYT